MFFFWAATDWGEGSGLVEDLLEGSIHSGQYFVSSFHSFNANALPFKACSIPFWHWQARGSWKWMNAWPVLTWCPLLTLSLRGIPWQTVHPILPDGNGEGEERPCRCQQKPRRFNRLFQHNLSHSGRWWRQIVSADSVDHIGSFFHPDLGGALAPSLPPTICICWCSVEGNAGPGSVPRLKVGSSVSGVRRTARQPSR